MAYVPTGFVDQRKIETGVQRAVKALEATVVRIRYDFGSDWTGDPSIFFRIVVKDEVAKKKKLGDVAHAITLILSREVKAEENGLHAYFNFRSVSEQADLKEAAWT